MNTRFKNLTKAILIIYKNTPKEALLRDFFSYINLFAEMFSISVAGKFLDEVVTILSQWEKFDITEFFYSRAFWYFSLELFLWIITLLTSNMKVYLRDKIYRAYYRKIQSNIVDKISMQNLQEVEDQKFQDLLAYVQKYSVENIFFSYENFTEFMMQLVKFFSVIGFVYSFVGPYSLLVLLFVLPESFAELSQQKKIAKYLKSSVYRVKMINYLLGILTDYTNFTELKVGGTFRRLKKLLKEKLSRQDSGMNKRDWHYWTDKTLYGVLDQSIFRFSSIYLIFLAFIKKLSIGDFQALYNYMKTAYSAIFNVFNKLFWMQKNAIYIDRYYEFLEYEGFGDCSTGEVKLAKGVPQIEFQKLDYKYHYQEKKSLENLSFLIKPAKKVLFVGGDSSGKTTLMRVLCGFYEITAGDYLVDNYSVRELARGELKRKISITDQDFNRYNFTIKENIVLNDANINDKRYEEVLQVAEVDMIMKKLKVKDNQMLGKFFNGGMEISPGFWQRVAIARMLYRKAEIYIMDEPFIFIDASSREKIVKNILKFVEDKTVIMISKEKYCTDLFDQIISLDKK